MIRNEDKYLQFFPPSLEETVTGKHIVLERAVLTHCCEKKAAKSAITMIHSRCIKLCSHLGVETETSEQLSSFKDRNRHQTQKTVGFYLSFQKWCKVLIRLHSQLIALFIDKQVNSWFWMLSSSSKSEVRPRSYFTCQPVPWKCILLQYKTFFNAKSIHNSKKVIHTIFKNQGFKQL